MRKLTSNPKIVIDGLELPINTGNGLYNCYIEPLEAIKGQLDAMLSNHRKVFTIRFDIRVHSYTDDNKVVSDFIRKYVRWAKRHYGMKRIAYVWCREVEKAKSQHYHLIFMLDGSKVNVAGNLKNKALEIGSIQDLSVRLCDKPSTLIKRSDLDEGNYDKYEQAFYRASYLAKERGKSHKGERSKSFDSSRVKAKID